MGNSSYLQLESGVLVPDPPAEYAPLVRALKQHDPHLSVGQVAGVWKVYFRASEDRPPEFLCDWRDPDGTPRELSFGLLDKVRRLDKNSRERAQNAEQLEVARQLELQKRQRTVAADLADDSVFKHGRPVLHRSKSLARARARTGYHYWKV